jgi:capsular exopolysaccharide synthesis family protein
MERIQTALQKVKEQRGSLWLSEPPSVVSRPPMMEAAWSRLNVCELNAKHIARRRIVTATRQDRAHAAFDMLRTRVLQDLRHNRWTSLAVTSPTAGCGKTTVSLNLALSLANQKDCRTLLVDLDLRRPQIAKMLGLRNPPSIENFLKGQSDVSDVFMRFGDNIAIAANSRPVAYAAELLQSPEAIRVLKNLKQELTPDVIIFDLPPMLSNDDVTSFLPNVDCVVLVAGAGNTTAREIDVCENELSQKSNVLGVVLNKCRSVSDKYGY